VASASWQLFRNEYLYTPAVPTTESCNTAQRGKNINSKTLLFAIMSKSISIDVPEEIWILISKDELLKKAMERIAVEEFRKLLLKYFVAEEITGVVDEKEIVRIDDELKEKAWKGLKQKWKL
jgi:hypothetical protein